MKVLHGDLISLAERGQFDVIIHGCNCMCQMGAGVAKTIKQRYPQAYRADCKTTKGDKTKLGTYTVSMVQTTMNGGDSGDSGAILPPVKSSSSSSSTSTTKSSKSSVSSNQDDETQGNKNKTDDKQEHALKPQPKPKQTKKQDCQTQQDRSRRHTFLIANAYTQYDWRKKKTNKSNPTKIQINADYDAIREVFHRIAHDFDGQRIGYPRIGAGLAGGDWKIISKIIDEELIGQDHTLVDYKPENK